MATKSFDRQFARHLSKIGMVTHSQLEEAKQIVALSKEQSNPISISEALVQTGIITEAQRINLEKHVRARSGGLKQLGQYRIKKKLGKGGMGAVYLAEDKVMKRKVAIKVLPRKLTKNPVLLSRFRREAQATGQLSHPNIVGAYTVGEEAGIHYYVMEYCDGESLEEMAEEQGVLHWRLALGYIKQAAEGLKYAHEQGFIHRDIKPSNLFVTDEHIVKVLDLGLTTTMEDKETALTSSGICVGTPYYISPEQAKGDRIDGRSDIYSLGVTLYFLITGEPPYHASNPALILSQHVNSEIPDPRKKLPDLPDPVAGLIMNSMAKNPDERYADCDAFIKTIEEVMDGKMPFLDAKELAKGKTNARGGTSRVIPVGGKRMGPGTSSGTRRALGSSFRRKAIGRRARDGGSRIREIQTNNFAPIRSKKIPVIVGCCVVTLLIAGMLAAVRSNGGKAKQKVDDKSSEIIEFDDTKARIVSLRSSATEPPKRAERPKRTDQTRRPNRPNRSVAKNSQKRSTPKNSATGHVKKSNDELAGKLLIQAEVWKAQGELKKSQEVYERILKDYGETTAAATAKDKLKAFKAATKPEKKPEEEEEKIEEEKPFDPAAMLNIQETKRPHKPEATTQPKLPLTQSTGSIEENVTPQKAQAKSGEPKSPEAKQPETKNQSPNPEATEAGPEPASNLKHGLRAYWKFDEGTGDKAQDSSGNGAGLKLKQCQWDRGVLGAALKLNGIDSWGEGPSFSLGETFSISVWINPEKGDGAAIFSKHDSRRRNLFYLRLYKNQYQVAIRSNSGKAHLSLMADSYRSGWQHLLCTGKVVGKQTNVVLYLNGNEIGRKRMKGTTKDMKGKGWNVGQEWDGSKTSDMFKGLIDELRVYNRILTNDEIQQLTLKKI